MKNTYYDMINSILDKKKPQDSVSWILDLIADRAIAELNRDIAACQNCPMCEVAKSFVTEGFAKRGCILMISGYVTEDQVRSGNKDFRPFVDSSIAEEFGAVLADRFTTQGLCYSDVVHCFPCRNNEVPRLPLAAEIFDCTRFLWRLITIIDPSAIMLMGQIPFNAVADDKGKYVADKDHGVWTSVKGIPAMLFQDPYDVYFLGQEETLISDIDEFIFFLQERHYDDNKILFR